MRLSGWAELCCAVLYGCDFSWALMAVLFFFFFFFAVAVMEVSELDEGQVSVETLQEWCVEEQAMETDIALLQQVEELERKVTSASLQVKVRLCAVIPQPCFLILPQFIMLCLKNISNNFSKYNFSFQLNLNIAMNKNIGNYFCGATISI